MKPTPHQNRSKTTVQRLTKAFSDAIPLGPHPNPYQEFISVRLDFVQDAVTELHRLQMHEQANTMWIEKTDWVQDTSQPGELGRHRADCLKDRIERLQASNTELREIIAHFTSFIESEKDDPRHAPWVAKAQAITTESP